MKTQTQKTEEHKNSLEKLCEVGTSVKRFAQKVFEPSADFGRYASATAGIMLALPYAIPTARRFFSGETNDYDFPSLSETLGTFAGGVAGSLANIYQFVHYISAAKEGNPELLLIPIITNIASGIYEVGRRSKA